MTTPFQLQRLGVLMEPEPGNPQEIEGVLNPGVARGLDGHLYLFPRLVAQGNFSRIGIARVKFNQAGDPCGVERLGIALEPEADYERMSHGGGGCEDPRITFVEPLQRYVMTYAALSPIGPRIAFAISEDFTAAEKKKILASLRQATETPDLKPAQTWGELIEDRGSQITFSGLGQQAPLEEKTKWDPDFAKRKKIKALLDKLIPEFSVRLGGATSIDVTKHGIDKAYGIRKLRDTLGIAIREMIFVGDALFPGGNDYPAEQAGALSIQVKNPHETKRVIETIIACLRENP